MAHGHWQHAWHDPTLSGKLIETIYSNNSSSYYKFVGVNSRMYVYIAIDPRNEASGDIIYAMQDVDILLANILE